MFNLIYQQIEKYSTIIIHRHTKPDGDAIGSQLALKTSILATFPDKKVYVVGDMIDRFSFVGEMDQIDDQEYLDALVFVLDCGVTHLISDQRYQNGKFLIKIDHHLPQASYGDIAYVDVKRESCAGIIADLIAQTPLVMTSLASTFCWLGMVTDSGRFRYSSTTVDTFATASYLLTYNPDTEYIYQQIYSEDYQVIKLKAILTLKFKIIEPGVAYLKNTYQEVKDYQQDPYSISRGMVNIMASIKGVDIWVNFTENEEGKILVEIRSNGYNINQVATKYGGGGHLQASGATVNDWETTDLIIADLVKVKEGNYV